MALLERGVGPSDLQTFFISQIMSLWFITTEASCLGCLPKVHRTILIKVPKIVVFNGLDMSVSLSNDDRGTLDKYLSLLDM